MGSGGLVAESFCQLLEQLWLMPTQVVNPSNFKRTFEGYDKQFAGLEQHDSQEFFVCDCFRNSFLGQVGGCPA